MTKKVTLEKLARMIQGGFKEVNTKIDKVDAKLDAKIDRVDAKVDRVIKDVKELKLTTQRIETRQEAEALRHDRHSILITDHEKRIKVLEKV